MPPTTTMEISKPAVSPSIRLERKHPLAIRWMHWINFPVLFTMIWSGILIYWNDSDNAYQHPHAIYRIGLGKLTLIRFFPDWFYQRLLVPYHVTQGLGYHFFFMWIFALNGIAYVLVLALSGEWRFLLPERRSLADAIQVTLVDLHLRKGLPEQKKYNGAQRIAYTSVILMGAGMLLTGVAIHELVTQFKCIEGWSQIVHWAGVRMADFIEAYPPTLIDGEEPKYVYMETPDGDYYTGYDLNVCRHPQTLLVTEMMGAPLTQFHGAPLRLHMPTKYGYKQIKRIGLISYTNEKPDDYWTKLGYDWYAGL
jgi:thiosulfate reductase cytochrome b subunit